jgi:anti-sigma factor RsiW
MSTTTYDSGCAREALLDERALHCHALQCEACQKWQAQERRLAELLRCCLPRLAAPRALRERIVAQLSAAEVSRPRWTRWIAGVAAAAALALAGVMDWPKTQPALSPQPLVREVLNDHLRVIYSEHPIEIQSGGVHRVKPWFTGRLDFAPELGFSGDDDFVLAGGAVGYVIDRKAATLVFKRRLHTISCFVFRAQGLPWPEGDGLALPGGRVRAHTRALDGFHLVMWRDAGLAYALVSDASEPELLRLGGKLAQAH